ncbi:MAG: asparagine synthase [Gammaproteobacteria bacterium]|nr:asparagine synthase [Gammaproteobacteria bacterium]
MKAGQGFCGWIGGSATAEALDVMLPGASVRLRGDGWGLAGEAEVSLAQDDGLVTLVVGRPRFLDPLLQAQVKELGLAGALLKRYRGHMSGVVAGIAGAFALVVLDLSRKQALLAVDRFGIARLCYAVLPEGVVFASSADLAVRHPQVSGQLSAQSLFHYVYFHCVPSPNTIYRQVHKLKPGEQLVLSQGKAHGTTYAPVRFCSPEGGDEQALARELRGCLDEAVRREADGEAAVGAFLSGGLDSSTVAGVLAKVRPEAPAKTFTMGFKAQGYDESGFARIVSQHFKTEHHEYYVTPADVEAIVPRVAAFYDEPFGNSSAAAAYYCAKLAKDSGVSVMLAGDGGDELFAGNERYAKQGLFEAYQHLPAGLRHYGIEAPLRLLGADKLPLMRKLASYVAQARVPLPDRLQSYNFLHRNAHGTVFQADFLAQVDTERPLKQLREAYHGCEAQSPVDRMLHLDWKFTLADNDLVKVSGMCALAGVDVRYPLLDHELVELSTRIPAGLKLKGRNLRYFYKRALSGFLPEATINKSKHGFGLPFGVWMRSEPQLQALAYDSLSALKTRGIFRSEFLDEAIAQHRNGHASYYGELVWILMMLELWLASHGAGL